ncbi:Transcription factor IIS [Artemisia annua]|uniref:Transcription factor IIS n=1 Tax=Artemisia annua TaxID=35608 RepID=A0A2U1PT56_ARTAN|nr:Transcription factor IIS [Artemisia annua]
MKMDLNLKLYYRKLLKPPGLAKLRENKSRMLICLFTCEERVLADDDSFIDDTGVDPADRYGSDQGGYSPSRAPQAEEGEEDDEIRGMFKSRLVGTFVFNYCAEKVVIISSIRLKVCHPTNYQYSSRSKGQGRITRKFENAKSWCLWRMCYLMEPNLLILLVRSSYVVYIFNVLDNPIFVVVSRKCWRVTKEGLKYISFAVRRSYSHIYTSNGVSLHELSIRLSQTRKFSSHDNEDLCSICADLHLNTKAIGMSPSARHSIGRLENLLLMKVYNPRMGMDALQVFPVSRATADRRVGRTGPNIDSAVIKDQVQRSYGS